MRPYKVAVPPLNTAPRRGLPSYGAVIPTIPTQPQADPRLLGLMRRMLVAQNNLALSGTLVTETSQGTFVQRAILDGARAQRYDCESPPAHRGEVIVDNGRSRYYYRPSNPTVDVQSSQVKTRRVRVPEVINEIRQGYLAVQSLGQAVIAGHSCEIVRVTPRGLSSADWYQYWIDPANGAQLRIEQYDAAGRRLSATYFTVVTYNPILEQGLFNPPGPVSAAPPRRTQQPTVPTPAEAGFTVLQPAYIPPGFHFQSASVSNFRGRKLVKLTYGNGLNALSLFEITAVRVPPRNPEKITSPNPGMVTTYRAGLRIILAGSLGEGVLRGVLNSLR